MPKREFRKCPDGGESRGILTPGGSPAASGWRAGIASKASALTMATCVSNEALCAGLRARIFPRASSEAVRHWRKKGRHARARGAGENYRECDRSRNLEMRGERRGIATRDRSWAGLHTRLRIRPVNCRNEACNETRDEKRKPSELVACVASSSRKTKKANGARRRHKAQGG